MCMYEEEINFLSPTISTCMYVCMCVQGHTLSSVKGTKEEATCAKRGLCDLTEGIACRVKHTCIYACMYVCKYLSKKWFHYVCMYACINVYKCMYIQYVCM